MDSAQIWIGDFIISLSRKQCDVWDTKRKEFVFDGSLEEFINQLKYRRVEE